jgi:hypothetical protein
MLKLLLTRNWQKSEYTIGRLSVRGEFFCNTLEDTVRDLTKTEKVYGKTAIPAGTYEVSMNIISPKYSKKPTYKWCDGRMPCLLGVPNFKGILIHPGNTADDSLGCILVGENKVKGRLVNSQKTFRRLWKILDEAYRNGERIEIEIQN